MIQDNETPTGAQMPQDIAKPSALLGGLSQTDFMMAHWQKKPLADTGRVWRAPCHVVSCRVV